MSYIKILESRIFGRDWNPEGLSLSDVTDPPDMSFTMDSDCLSTLMLDNFDDLPEVIKKKFTEEQKQKYIDGDLYLAAGTLHVSYKYDEDDGVTFTVINRDNYVGDDYLNPFGEGEDITDYISTYEDVPKGAFGYIVKACEDHLKNL